MPEVVETNTGKIETLYQVLPCVSQRPGLERFSLMVGNNEVIVGQALKKLPREQVVVETKCGIVWERKGSLFNKVGDRQLYKNLSPECVKNGGTDCQCVM